VWLCCAVLCQVLIDRRQYELLEGSWRDLLTKLKWDVTKSVLKSAAGLQGRKFKVRSRVF
jgi:hypothetical protein